MMYKDIKSVEPDNFSGCILSFDYYWPRDKDGAKQRVKAINKILKRLQK